MVFAILYKLLFFTISIKEMLPVFFEICSKIAISAYNVNEMLYIPVSMYSNKRPLCDSEVLKIQTIYNVL